MKLLKWLPIIIFLSCKTVKTNDSDVVAIHEKITIYDINHSLVQSDTFFNKKILIERTGSNLKFIRFPKGGTLTEVYISSSHDTTINVHLNSIETGLLWYINHVSDGEYHASYGSCNYGGYIKIEIRTPKSESKY